MAMDDFRPVVCEGPEGPSAELTRVFGGKIEEKKVFNEEWLQELLRVHESILPVREIEHVFVPLICIGREVGVPPAGAIDNLYISPSGYLTIVETKLWRNTEARREVVAQVIDYATHLTKWNFDRLDKAARQYFGNKKYFKNPDGTKGLREAVKEKVGEKEFDETEFTDNVNRNLQKGRVLLLIVGDGIREDIQEMTEFLQKWPTLLYKLALVEIRCYRVQEGKDWPLIAIPRIVARTKEIGRTIISIRYEQEKPEVKEVKEAGPPAGDEKILWTKERFLGAVESTGDEKRYIRLKRIWEIAEKEDITEPVKTKNPSFLIRTRAGLQLMSFIAKTGIIYTVFKANRFEGGEEDRDRFIDRLNSLGIFGYKTSEVEQGHGKYSQRPIEDMTDEAFEDFVALIREAIEGKIE